MCFVSGYCDMHASNQTRNQQHFIESNQTFVQKRISNVYKKPRNLSVLFKNKMPAIYSPFGDRYALQNTRSLTDLANTLINVRFYSFLLLNVDYEENNRYFTSLLTCWRLGFDATSKVRVSSLEQSAIACFERARNEHDLKRKAMILGGIVQGLARPIHPRNTNDTSMISSLWLRARDSLIAIVAKYPLLSEQRLLADLLKRLLLSCQERVLPEQKMFVNEPRLAVFRDDFWNAERLHRNFMEHASALLCGIVYRMFRAIQTRLGFEGFFAMRYDEYSLWKSIELRVDDVYTLSDTENKVLKFHLNLAEFFIRPSDDTWEKAFGTRAAEANLVSSEEECPSSPLDWNGEYLSEENISKMEKFRFASFRFAQMAQSSRLFRYNMGVDMTLNILCSHLLSARNRTQ